MSNTPVSTLLHVLQGIMCLANNDLYEDQLGTHFLKKFNIYVWSLHIHNTLTD